jgi:hypothetical protein
MDDNVIVVQFDEPSKAYQALSELNRIGSEGKVDVKSAVLLERSKDGTVQTPEGADNAAGYYLASGALIGLLVGAARRARSECCSAAQLGRWPAASANLTETTTRTSPCKPSASASSPGVPRWSRRSQSLPKR